MSKEIKKNTTPPSTTSKTPTAPHKIKEWLNWDGKGKESSNLEKGEKGQARKPIMETPIQPPPPKKKE